MSQVKDLEKRQLRAIKRVLTVNYADLSSFIEAASPLYIGQKLVAAGIVSAESFKGNRHHDIPTFASCLLNSAMTALEYGCSLTSCSSLSRAEKLFLRCAAK